MPSLVSMTVIAPAMQRSKRLEIFEVARLLHALPNLQQLAVSRDVNIQLISCRPDNSTAADLTLLEERLLVLDSTHFCFEFILGELDQEPLSSFLTALPCMLGVIDCSFSGCRAADLRLLLDAFPDLQNLSIDPIAGISDLQLHAVAACSQLKTLSLDSCNGVSPMELLALCRKLPMLTRIVTYKCRQFTPLACEKFSRMLIKQGLLRVEIYGDE